MNQFLNKFANDAVLRAAYEINSAFLRCQSGELRAAVSLGYEVSNLRLANKEMVCNLIRTLYLINEEAAGFIRESVLSRQVKESVLKVKTLFDQSRAGDLDAYREMVRLARNLPNAGEELQTLLELGIEDAVSLEFLLEASDWMNSHISKKAN